MRILHASCYAVQPWKNGGGMTTEIIAAPPGASFETFDWRISMANVAAAGPFSMFAGIDRSLGLLEGAGIILAIEGRGEIALAQGAHPAVFPGDVPVSARLAGEPILDLNVMTRRGRWRHQLSRTAASDAFELARRGDVTIALVRGANGTANGDAFSAGDAIVMEHATTARLTLSQPCTLWIADLWQMP